MNDFAATARDSLLRVLAGIPIVALVVLLGASPLALALNKGDQGSADRAVYVDDGNKDRNINFSGSNAQTTRWRYVDNQVAYCVHPAIGSSGTSGEMPARTLRASDYPSENAYRAAVATLYYGPGGPGYGAAGKALFPATRYDGSPMDEDNRMATAHILLGVLHNGGWKQAWYYPGEDRYLLPPDAYSSWFDANIMRTSGSLNAQDTLVAKLLALSDDEHMVHNGGYTFDDFASKVLWVLTGGVNANWPYQDLITWDGSAPSLGQVSLAKHSANPSFTGRNPCYRLKGARYGIFKSEEAARTRNASSAVAVGVTGQSNSDGTQADDYFNTGMSLQAGDYWVSELSPSEGFARDTTVYKVSVAPGRDTRVNGSFVEERPLYAESNLWTRKSDGDRGISSPQGDASIAEAVFTIRRYDGYHNPDELPSNASDTWTVKTDASGNAVTTDAARLSGSSLTRSPNGLAMLPLGTYSIVESAAPPGYLLGDGNGNGPRAYVFQVVADASSPSGASVKPIDYGEPLAAGNMPVIADCIKRGGVEIPKVDREAKSPEPLGSASLAGAKIEVVLESPQPAVIGGTTFNPGDTVLLLTTGDDGCARSDTRDLPYGTYRLREVEAPEGYLLNREWSEVVEVREDGVTVASKPLDDQVKRGDVRFNKASADSMRRLAGIPFLVTSKTTGESHVLVTDQNGSLDSSSGWAPHSHETNANDRALISGDGKARETSHAAHEVDTDLLEASAGIWFSGSDQRQTEANDSLGALPYDTYTFRELSCPANDAYELVEFEVQVYRDGYLIDLGTIDDQLRTIPSISTELTCSGSHTAPAAETVTLTDTVRYSELSEGKDYTLAGTLMDADTGEPAFAGDACGSASASFTARKSEGQAEVTFEIPTTDLAGRRIVAFQELFDADGRSVAVHKDLDATPQTVAVPHIATRLATKGGSKCSVIEGGRAELADRVDYGNLVPGCEYRLSAELHVKSGDGSDGGVLLDADGNPVVAMRTFTPPASAGSVTVEFSFPCDTQTPLEAVAFETLLQGDAVFAKHEDIADPEQTATLSPGPALEKYIDKDVHRELDSLDDIFRYDILAYITADAAEATVTDELANGISFANDAPAVRIFDLGTENNHQTDGAWSGANHDATVSTEGKDITQQCAVATEGKLLNVTVPNIESLDLRGHWIRVSFEAKATEDSDHLEVKDNAPVLSEKKHTGIPNTASYAISIRNPNPEAEDDGLVPGYREDSNIVTVKPPHVASEPEPAPEPEPEPAPGQPEPEDKPTRIPSPKQNTVPHATGSTFDQTGNLLSGFWWIPVLLLAGICITCIHLVKRGHRGRFPLRRW